jgi:hypothetical protein
MKFHTTIQLDKNGNINLFQYYKQINYLFSSIMEYDVAIHADFDSCIHDHVYNMLKYAEIHSITEHSVSFRYGPFDVHVHIK